KYEGSREHRRFSRGPRMAHRRHRTRPRVPLLRASQDHHRLCGLSRLAAPAAIHCRSGPTTALTRATYVPHSNPPGHGAETPKIPADPGFRIAGPRRRAAPALPEALRKMLAARPGAKTPIGARDRAMLLLGFGDVETVPGRGLHIWGGRPKRAILYGSVFPAVTCRWHPGALLTWLLRSCLYFPQCDPQG